MAANLGTAFGQVVIGSDTRGLAGAQRGLATFAKGATVAGTVIGVGFAAAIGSAVGAAATFEQQLADLRSVARPTATEFDALREQALKLGADTKFSAQEAAAAQTELAKGGLGAAEILGGALPGALALAAAGDLELADAATISVNAMKQFGLAGEDVTGIADALAVAANQTTADVSDFGAALTQGSAMAQQAGWSFEDTMAALSALADAGVKGSDAGTSMKTSLQQLINPTAKQAKLARELGISWLDQNGAMKDAEGISRELVRATSGMTQAERARTFSILAGSDGFRTLSALYSAAPAGIRGYIRAQSQAGAAAETAAIRQDTLQGKMEEFGGALETIKIRVGSALLPGLSAATVAAADFLGALSDSDDVEAFGDALADGFDAGQRAAVAFWGAAEPVVRDLGGIATDAWDGFTAAASGAAPVLLTTGEAVATLGSAAVAVVAPIVSLTSALAQVPGMAQAGTAALVGLAAAMGAAKAISWGTTLASSAQGLIQVAQAARSATVATTALNAAQGRGAAVAVVSSAALARQATYTKMFGGSAIEAARAAGITAAATNKQTVTAAAAARTYANTFAPAMRTTAAATAQTASRAAVLATVFPRTASALAMLGSPAGIAAVAIGGLVTGLVLLSSQSGASSAAQAIAAANDRLAEGANRAKAALDGLNNTLAAMQDANLGRRQAELDLANALQQQKTVRQQITDGELKGAAARNAGRQAALNVEQAEIRLSRARSEEIKQRRAGITEGQRQLQERGANLNMSRMNVSALAQESVKQRALAKTLRESATAQNGLHGSAQRASAAERESSQVTANLQKNQQQLVARLNAAPSAYNKQIKYIREMAEAAGPGKAQKNLNAMARELENIRDQDIANALAAATEGADALGQPLKDISPAVKAAADRFDDLRSSAEGLGDIELDFKTAGAVQNLRDVQAAADDIEPPDPIPLEANDEATPIIDALAGKVTTLNGRIATVTLREVTIRETRNVTTGGGAPGGGGGPNKTSDEVGQQAAAWEKAGQEIGRSMAREMTTGAVSAIDALRQGFDRLYAERQQREDALIAMQDRHQAQAEARELAAVNKRIANAEKAARKAKAADRASARQAVTDAKRERAQLLKDRQIAAREARQLEPLQARIDQIEVAESALSDLESSLSDIGGRIADALQRSLDDALKGLDRDLRTGMDGIEAAANRVDAAIEGGMAVSLADVVGISDGLRNTLEHAAAALAAALRPIDQELDRLGRRITAIDQQIEAMQSRREERDNTRRRGELATAQEAADRELAAAAERSARLREAVERARSAAERRAAESMLAEAVAAEAEKRAAATRAAEDITDFEEDVLIARLQRERQALDESVNQNREARQQAVDDARNAAQAAAEAERVALQTRVDNERAALEEQHRLRQEAAARELGDLREQLRAGEITHQEALQRLAGIYANPEIAAAVSAAGRTLGLDFARGMQRSRAAVEKSAEALAGIVRKYLPQSPAEKGPLAYDQRLPGIAVAEGMAHGIAARRRLVETEATRMAAAAARAGIGVGIGPGQWAAGGDTYHQQVDVHVANPVEDARAAAARMGYELRTFGGRF